jgi:D-alanyl-D-alanine carboxypeptidase
MNEQELQDPTVSNPSATTHEQPTVPDPDALTPAEAFKNTFIEEGNATLRRIGAIAVLLVILAGLLTVLSPDIQFAGKRNVAHRSETSSEYLRPTAAFPKVELQAKAAYVYDVRSQKSLFAKNAHAQLPLASITKLMTVLVAADLFHNEGLLAFGSEHSDVDSGSPFPSAQWIPNDVFTYTLIQSSNQGASTIAAAVGTMAPDSYEHSQARDIFIEHMNSKARELGLTQTYFINETGLDASQAVGGGYGSARDAAMLLSALAESSMQILEQTRLPAVKFTAAKGSSMVAINTNTDIGSVAGLIGSKTGYTKLAGGNLAVLFDADLGRPIIIVVLGSTEEGRFSDVKTLADATRSYITGAQTQTL